MKIIIGSDHGGFQLKQYLKEWLLKNKYSIIDVGTTSTDMCDYVDYAQKVAYLVKSNPENKGILICGTGIGMSISANRTPGIYAALCTNEEMAKLSREHNNSNILCLGGRITSRETATKILDIWLTTPFSTVERYKKRIDKLDNM